MMVTEPEARKRWCPFARQPGKIIGPRSAGTAADEVIGYVAQNRGLTMDGALDGCRCLASGCMAWRNHGPDTEVVSFEVMGQKPDGEGWTCILPEEGREEYSIKSRWERKIESLEGFCGLAGQP